MKNEKKKKIKENPFYVNKFIKVKPFGADPPVEYPLTINLYENKKFLPRVRSAPEVAFLKESEDNFPRIIEDPHDFSRWRAYIDGRKTPIYYANYIYQGREVPWGKT